MDKLHLTNGYVGSNPTGYILLLKINNHFMKEFLLSIIAGMLSNKISDCIRNCQNPIPVTAKTTTYSYLNLGFYKRLRISEKG